MALLITIERKGNVRIKNEFIDLCPMFSSLDSDEVRFMVMFTDNWSPYRQLTNTKRRKIVSKDVFGKEDDPKSTSEKMQKCIDRYDFLQYDPLIQRRDVLRSKLNQLNDLINSVDLSLETAEGEKLNDKLASISKRSGFIKTIRSEASAYAGELEDVEEKIERKGPARNIRGGSTLSQQERLFLEDSLPLYVSNKSIFEK